MNTQKIFSTTMLDFLLTSKGSVNTVYNKVIVNMQCHIIFASLGLIYTTGKRKYFQHICWNFISIPPLSYLCYETNDIQHSILANIDNWWGFGHEFEQGLFPKTMLKFWFFILCSLTTVYLEDIYDIQ